MLLRIAVGSNAVFPDKVISTRNNEEIFAEGVASLAFQIEKGSFA
jgi:hypothetical protein